MRLSIVHDDEGRIIAAAACETEGLVARPVPVDLHHQALEVEVPEEHGEGDLMEICQRLRVDTARQVLVPSERDTS
ncbi:hypothetical protein [Streptomyces sp. NPDC059092]|uniref:hypothetical protein n=1 Tax=Streptomyces sp. NPDC059092 TaxID=3346725 RepID=UPI0036ABCA71